MALIKRILHEDPDGNLYIIEWWRHAGGMVTKTVRAA